MTGFIFVATWWIAVLLTFVLAPKLERIALALRVIALAAAEREKREAEAMKEKP